MKLHNTRSKQVEQFKPLDSGNVRIYSCGPTVYDHIHIGNLSSFIFADTLRRVLATANPQQTITHVMNFTDVDDKTIRRSRERYPDLDPNEALQKLTSEYADLFLEDMHKIGNDVGAYTFMKATDNIVAMQELITALHTAGFAYLADDGVYFSIAKYRESGKVYGQLLELTAENTSEARIQNDEYDKESVHDFALWKAEKPGEPAWNYELDGQHINGRPGWHIECSAMSKVGLGQPFDVHTGGVDLIFPHHENEIAQSTATQENPVMASFFAHNEHLLVDGKKMSKSLQNFFTLQDIEYKGFDPLAFRLMVQQAHYRSQSNFTWDNLAAAANRLRHYQAVADLRFQPVHTTPWLEHTTTSVLENMQDDLDSPRALASFSAFTAQAEEKLIDESEVGRFIDILKEFDDIFGLKLLQRTDINQSEKELIAQRQQAREAQNWQEADRLRDELKQQGIELRDTPHGAIWSRL